MSDLVGNPEDRFSRQEDKEMTKLYRSISIYKSKRQPPSLKKLLTKAKFTYRQWQIPTVKKCKEPRCGLCKYIIEESSSSRQFQ